MVREKNYFHFSNHIKFKESAMFHPRKGANNYIHKNCIKTTQFQYNKLTSRSSQKPMMFILKKTNLLGCNCLLFQTLVLLLEKLNLSNGLSKIFLKSLNHTLLTWHRCCQSLLLTQSLFNLLLKIDCTILYVKTIRQQWKWQNHLEVLLPL